MYIIFIIAWIISPFVLIPLLVKRTKENNKLKSFVDSLCRSGRISAAEYISLEAEKTEKESSAKNMETSAPVFADSRDFSKVHGGDAVRAVENNTVSEKKIPDTPVSEKPAAPEVKDVKPIALGTYKNLYDLPVYSYPKTPTETAKPVTQNSERNADREVRHAVPAAVPAERKETVKPAAEKIARANVKPNREKNKAAAMSVLMMIGIIFVILAGLVFSTAVWATMGEVGRTLAVGIVAALFFGVSAFTGKKLKLERTSFAFYILGTFFSAITLLTASFFGIMGNYFSVSGAGSCLLYAAALLIISLFTAKGRSIFNMSASAYISAFSGIFAAVLLLVQLSDSIGVFALLAAILTAVTNVFMYVLNLKISDKWEKPLRIASAVLNAVALIGGISAAFGENSAFYAAAVIFVLRSIAAAVMGFMGRKTYKTGLAAVSSLGSGAFFALLIMFKLSVSVSVFALSAGIFAVLFAFGMFTFNIKIPEGWKDPIKMSAFILNALGIISSAYALMRNFGEWDGVCFAVAALYIVSSFTAGIMAVCGHSRYSEAPSAFASMFTGLAFSVMLVAELSASGEIAALCLTVMLIVLVNALYTVPSKFPESWRTAAGVSTAILGLISVFSSMFALIGNFGNWDAACCTIAALYILQAAVVTAAAYRGHGEYSKGCWAVFSQLVGIFFSVLAIAQLAEKGISFMLYLTIFAVAYLNFVHTFGLKKPENWETSLKVFSYLLGIFGIIFAFPQMLYHSEWTYHFYVTAAIYIAYAIAVTAMAFLKHDEYSKTHWAIVSQITGISFIITLLSRLAESKISFMLYLTIFAAAYLNFVYTFKLKKPESWKIPLKIFSYFLGVFGVIFTASQMLGYDQWTYHFYVTIGIYIAYAIAVTAMAFLKHDEYSKTHWAVISQIMGISFIITLLSRLAESEISFMLYLTVFAVAYLNFVYTFGLKKPENWAVPLKIFSYFLGVFGVIFTASQMFGHEQWTYHFYVTIGIYIAYAIAVTAMAFFGHDEYFKTHWAVISQITGISFIITLLSRLAESEISFMLYLTIFAVVYLNFVYTFGMKKPEKWAVPLKIFSYFLGAFGVIFTASQMLGYDQWTYHFYVTIGIYIAYAIAVTAMAFLKHDEYSKTHWAVISQIMGIIFSLSIIYKIVYPTELFVLIFAAFAALYTAAVYFAFMKMPEKWVKVTNVTDIIFNIAAAVFAAGLLISDFGSWDIYCFLTALLYIVYTAVRGVRRGNVFLKAAECVVSSIAAYNLYCIMDIKDFAVPEFLLVCMMFALAMIHHFVKPLRTLFSDIFFTAGLTVSASLCALTLCLFEYNICGTLGFAFLGAAMLLKAVEADKKRAVAFKVLLPLPVSGMVFSFIHFISNISGGLGDLAAINGIVLALTAAAIMFVRKKSDPTFYSFAFTASVFIFIGTASELTAVLIILLAVSVMLTVLFYRCRNNLPSLLTMAGTAAVVYRLADIALLHADFNVSLLFAAVFAAVCLAASRIFYSKKLLDREEGRLQLDTCCLEMLLALPLIHSANEKVTAFAVLTILAAFAANLVRKEHSGDANRVALTIACGLFAIALIFRPFLIVSDGLVSRKITLGIISAFGFAFSKIWAKYPKLSENFSSAVYGISFVCLIIDALSHQNLFNTLIVLAVSALILLYSFISKKKRWFAVSSVSLLGLTIYAFRDFFTMIDWWVYLLIVGLILIAVSAANEYFVRKGREFKEKAGRFFEDWKW